MTNRTPRPTDALPLPELPTTSYLGDGNGYGYDSSDMYAYGYIVRREGYELAKQALVKPIHDPAVTTPREVLVGESPVDRIAAPAQEQPRGTKDGSRRWVLLQSLKASKGWATEFAEAFIDEFLSTEAQQQAGAVVGSPKYRLLQRNVDEIMPDDEFLAEDATTWAVDPNGIFVGLTYGGVVLRPARRALKAGGVA